MSHKAHHVDIDLPVSHGLLVRIILTCVGLVLVWGAALVFVLQPDILEGAPETLNDVVANVLGSADETAHQMKEIPWQQRFHSVKEQALETVDQIGEMLEAPTVPEEALAK